MISPLDSPLPSSLIGFENSTQSSIVSASLRMLGISTRLLISVCVLTSAYAFQICRFSAGKLFGPQVLGFYCMQRVYRRSAMVPIYNPCITRLCLTTFRTGSDISLSIQELHIVFIFCSLDRPHVVFLVAVRSCGSPRLDFYAD